MLSTMLIFKFFDKTFLSYKLFKLNNDQCRKLQFIFNMLFICGIFFIKPYKDWKMTTFRGLFRFHNFTSAFITLLKLEMKHSSGD